MTFLSTRESLFRFYSDLSMSLDRQSSSRVMLMMMVHIHAMCLFCCISVCDTNGAVITENVQAQKAGAPW